MREDRKGALLRDGPRAERAFSRCLDDWVGDDNPVHVIEAFVEALDLGGLGFDGVLPRPRAGRRTIRPSC